MEREGGRHGRAVAGVVTEPREGPAGLRRLGRVYEDIRGRIGEVVSAVGDEAVSIEVPACPEWSVKDVVSHLTGNCTDIITGNLDGIATPSWTAAQVAARSERTLTEILDEWEQAGPQVAAVVDDFPGRYGQQLVADATVHEHDLRGALDRPGARDSDAVQVAVDYLVAVFLQPGVSALGLEPLEVRTEAGRWVAGAGGEPSADLDGVWRRAVTAIDNPYDSTVEPAGFVNVQSFELFRAVTGRRSAAQIRAFAWSIDPEPYLPVFGFGPFAIRSEELHE